MDGNAPGWTSKALNLVDKNNNRQHKYDESEKNSTKGFFGFEGFICDPVLIWWGNR